MTKQTNIANAIGHTYIHASPLRDIALASDLLAGYVLAGCPKSAMPALIQEFGEVSQDFAEFGNLEDTWSDYVWDIITEYIEETAPDCEFARDDFYHIYDKQIMGFYNRIEALSEILNQEEVA